MEIKKMFSVLWYGIKIALFIGRKNDKLIKMNKIEEQLKNTKEK